MVMWGKVGSVSYVGRVRKVQKVCVGKWKVWSQESEMLKAYKHSMGM